MRKMGKGFFLPVFISGDRGTMLVTVNQKFRVNQFQKITKLNCLAYLRFCHGSIQPLRFLRPVNVP